MTADRVNNLGPDPLSPFVMGLLCALEVPVTSPDSVTRSSFEAVTFARPATLSPEGRPDGSGEAA